MKFKKVIFGILWFITEIRDILSIAIMYFVPRIPVVVKSETNVSILLFMFLIWLCLSLRMLQSRLRITPIGQKVTTKRKFVQKTPRGDLYINPEDLPEAIDYLHSMEEGL